MTRFLSVGVVSVMVCGLGCTPSHESIFTEPTVVTPTPRLLTLPFDRGGVYAGESSRGTVTLSLAAVRAVTVSLSSSDPAVVVPESVVVPPGSTSATFTGDTRMVSRDVDATVTASFENVTVVDGVSVWADLPVSFTWTSDPGNSLARGGLLPGFGRVTPDTGSFVAAWTAAHAAVPAYSSCMKRTSRRQAKCVPSERRSSSIATDGRPRCMARSD